MLSREERTGQNQGSFWEQLILNKGLKERKQEWRMQAGAKEAPERRKRIRKEESCERTQPIPAGPELEVTGGKMARDPAKEGSGAGSRRKLCVTTDSVQSVQVQRAPCEPAGAAAAAPERSEGGLRQAEQREQHTHRQTDRQTEGRVQGAGRRGEQAKGPGTTDWREAGGDRGRGGLGACVAPGSAPVLGGGPLSKRSNLSGIPFIHKVRICNISD